jgi:hypothetical protein
MYSKEVLNPGDNPCNENQAEQDNEKPFYYLFELEFFLLFFLIFCFNFMFS